MDDTPQPLTQGRLSWHHWAQTEQMRTVGGQWESESIGHGPGSQLEQEKGPGPDQPLPLSCDPSLRSSSLLPPPSSLLPPLFCLPWVPGEAQVTEHPLAEGINALN